MTIQTIRLEEQEGFSLLAKRTEESAQAALENLASFAEEQASFIAPNEFYHVVIHDLDEGVRDYYALRIKRDLNERPETMEVLNVPSFTYLVADHEDGSALAASYEALNDYLKTIQYRPYITAQSPLSNPFPLKLEYFTQLEAGFTDSGKRQLRIPVQKQLYNEEID